MEATKRPWITFQQGNKHVIFQEQEDVTIAVTAGWSSQYRKEEAANARFIVQAVNHFEEMKAACEAALARFLEDSMEGYHEQHPVVLLENVLAKIKEG